MTNRVRIPFKKQDSVFARFYAEYPEVLAGVNGYLAEYATPVIKGPIQLETKLADCKTFGRLYSMLKEEQDALNDLRLSYLSPIKVECVDGVWGVEMEVNGSDGIKLPEDIVIFGCQYPNDPTLLNRADPAFNTLVYSFPIIAFIV